MKYVFLFLLIVFTVCIEGAIFFSFQELFFSAFVGGVSGVIWELCKLIGAKIEERDIRLSILIPGIVAFVLCVALALVYFNYEIGAKSALLALYLGFFVSEIWADCSSKISKKISSKVGLRPNKNN
ncbi:hypothetical protein O3682_05430 [Neisseria sp. 27098_8_112]|uniref:hypothetical protein n=1 Tax=Neisseria sp. 27098_8_112 TaxID=3003682 RepID=UPI00352FAC2B